jgi:hypothetical protein
MNGIASAQRGSVLAVGEFCLVFDNGHASLLSDILAKILFGARRSRRFSTKEPERLQYSRTLPTADGEAT